jgi:hypothetical protein
MGRRTILVEGLTEADHQELGLELAAIGAALVDVRTLITARMRSGSPAYLAVGKVLHDLKNLARILDEDLRIQYGGKIELRKCYKGVLE